MVEAEGETADLPGPSSGEEEQDPPAGRGHGQPGPEDGPPHTENHPDLLLLLHSPPHRTQTQHRDAVRQDHGDGAGPARGVRHPGQSARTGRTLRGDGSLSWIVIFTCVNSLIQYKNSYTEPTSLLLYE